MENKRKKINYTSLKEMNKNKLNSFIKKFEAFLKKYPSEFVDMNKKSYDGCGSPACFGSWVHAILNEKYDLLKGHRYLHFKMGGTVLAKYLLEYDSYMGLELWAKKNPDIWGNEYGHLMFSHDKAFNEGDKEFYLYNKLYIDDKLPMLSLEDILYKWKMVEKRLNEQSKT